MRRNSDSRGWARQAEQSAETRERLLMNAQRIANMGSWELDLESNRLLWSDQIFEIFGVRPDEFDSTYESFFELVHPEDRDALQASQDAALSGEHGLDIVHRIVRPGGDVRYVHELGELIESGSRRVLAGTVHDVTELRRAEEKIRETTRMVELASQAARLGGWSFDLASGTTTWTDETAAIHGEPPGTSPSLEDGLGYYAPEHREGIERAFWACARDGTPFDETLQIVTADGRRVWVRAIGEAERGADGAIVAVYGAFQDVTELVAAREESGRLSRQLLDTLDSISDAFLLLDREWRVRFVNRQGERLLDRRADELSGRSVWEMFPEAVGSSFERQYLYALEHDEQVSFVEYYAPLEKWFSVDAYPTKEGLAIYFQDVTQVRLLEMAVSRLNDVVLITEGTPLDEPGPRIIYVNDAFERLTGYSRTEAVGRTPRILQGPGTDRRELDRIRAALEAREHVRAELVNYTKQGREIWTELDIVPIVNEAGVHSHSVAVQRDVTERRRAEAATRLSEQRFRLIAQATTDVVFDWNLAADTVWWNEGIRKLFGYELENLEPDSRSWADRIHPDDRDRVLVGVGAVIDGEADQWGGEYRFRRADGSFADVVDRGFAIRDDDGDIARFVGCMVDVTEQRRLEEQLRQAQRLEAVGQLTGGVAHDFNNLLTVILGNAELLVDAAAHDEDMRVDAEMIRAAAQRGAQLTNRLLAFSRRQPLEPRITDVGALSSGMERLLRRTLGEHIEIDLVHADKLWEAIIDPAQLESAILNLSLNARDAMPSGGWLTIGTANRTIDEHGAEQLGIVPGDYVVLSVSDTGHGMDERTISHAFEPFFTTKDVQAGSGLGLSMVYGFVKQSRGHVTIYSETERGTTIKLYLPRAADADELGDAEIRHDGAIGGAERILVVEDEHMVREFVLGLLERLGYRTVGVENGVAALEALQGPESFDLLFTDVVLPGGLDGRELAETARSRHPDLPVLFTSGYTQEAIVHDGRLDPGVHLLSKPYSMQELASKVREVLDAGRALATDDGSMS